MFLCFCLIIVVSWSVCGVEQQQQQPLWLQPNLHRGKWWGFISLRNSFSQTETEESNCLVKNWLFIYINIYFTFKQKNRFIVYVQSKEIWLFMNSKATVEAKSATVF